jgi:hypothetical protein
MYNSDELIEQLSLYDKLLEKIAVENLMEREKENTKN